MIEAGQLSDSVIRSEGIGAINEALRALGVVVKADGQFKEFDAVNLGLHRRTENWRCRPGRNMSSKQSVSDDEDTSRVKEARRLFEDDNSDY